MRPLLAAAVLSVLAAPVVVPAWADPPTGQPTTLLKLSETQTVTVRPDEITASLRADVMAGTAAEAQGKVNAAIADALAKARSVGGVTASTGGYNVWRAPEPPVPHPGTGPTPPERWQASQSIELKAADGAALLGLVGTLQKTGLAINQLGWHLSPEASRRAHDDAMKKALAALRARADAAAGLLGLRFERFQEIRLDGNRAIPMAPRAMSAAMATGAPPPSAESEDVPVPATAEADILLVPAQ